MAASVELRIAVGERAGEVSGLLLRPGGARLLYVLAHGAGAGMRHPFLESIAQRLAERSIATLRYQFLYMEQRGRRPDPPAVAAATVRAAVAEAARLAPGLPLIAGGKSFGGRMTSTAQAEAPLPGVRRLVFLGFPLHPPGRPDTKRAEHRARGAGYAASRGGRRPLVSRPQAVGQDGCGRNGRANGGNRRLDYGDRVTSRWGSPFATKRHSRSGSPPATLRPARSPGPPRSDCVFLSRSGGSGDRSPGG